MHASAPSPTSCKRSNQKDPYWALTGQIQSSVIHIHIHIHTHIHISMQTPASSPTGSRRSYQNDPYLAFAGQIQTQTQTRPPFVSAVYQPQPVSSYNRPSPPTPPLPITFSNPYGVAFPPAEVKFS